MGFNRGGCGGGSRRHDGDATHVRRPASTRTRGTQAVRIRNVRGNGHGGGARSWLGANCEHTRLLSSDAVTRLRDSALARLGASGDANTSLGVACAHWRLAVGALGGNGAVTRLDGCAMTRLGESAHSTRRERSQRATRRQSPTARRRHVQLSQR